MAGQDERDEPLEYAIRERVPKRFVHRLNQGVPFDWGMSHPASGTLNVATKPDSGQELKNDITEVMRNNFRRIFNNLRQRHEYQTVLDSLNELVDEEIQRERYLVFVRQRLQRGPNERVSFQEVADRFNDTIQNVQSILNPDYFLPGIDEMHVDRVSSVVLCRVHSSIRQYSVSFRKFSSQANEIVTRNGGWCEVSLEVNSEVPSSMAQCHHLFTSTPHP